MKTFVSILTLLFISSFGFSQTTVVNQTDEETTTETVRICPPTKDERSVAYFVNGVQYTKSLTNLNPEQLESMNVRKQDTIINDTEYSGQIWIQLKEEVNTPEQ